MDDAHPRRAWRGRGALHAPRAGLRALLRPAVHGARSEASHSATVGSSSSTRLRLALPGAAPAPADTALSPGCWQATTSTPAACLVGAGRPRRREAAHQAHGELLWLRAEQGLRLRRRPLALCVRASRDCVAANAWRRYAPSTRSAPVRARPCERLPDSCGARGHALAASPAPAPRPGPRSQARGAGPESRLPSRRPTETRPRVEPARFIEVLRPRGESRVKARSTLLERPRSRPASKAAARRCSSSACRAPTKRRAAG